MPGKDGTGPPGIGPCGKPCSECPKRFGADEKKKVSPADKRLQGRRIR